MSDATKTKADLLDAGFKGDVILPGQAEYECARRVWNGLADCAPCAVLRCASTTDVQKGVRFARDRVLPLAVRGGGHSVAGYGTVDGGIVLDLVHLNDVSLWVDGTVTAGGGATWGIVDAATQQVARAVPGGVFSRTGIAGLTLGGGYGWIRNRYGLSARSLRSAQVVTADGECVTASANENPDLLWALRGGGGNFGVVTAFTFDTHPVARTGYFLFVFHDARGDAGARGLRLFREFCRDAPDAVSLLAFLGRVPAEAEGFAPGSAGVPFVGFAGFFLGDPDDGRRLLAPLHEYGTPLLDLTGVMAYVDVQQIFDTDYPDGARYYWKSTNVTVLDEEVIDILVAAALAAPSELSTIDIWHVTARAARPFNGAFFPSPAPFLVNLEANWVQPKHDRPNIDWVRESVARLSRFSDGSRYLNFAGFNEDGQIEMASSFDTHLARLTQVKARWDPHNVFRLNQNIVPTPTLDRHRAPARR